MKIILVDPDDTYARGLRYHLQQAGYQVFILHDITTLRDLVRKQRPDLVIIDQSTIEIAGTRPFAGTQPVAKFPFLVPLDPIHMDTDSADSNLSNEAQRQQAEAIIGRLRTLKRGRISRVRVGRLALNFDRKLASFCGNPLPLTPLQFKLISVLALNAKRVVGYQDLLEQVWGVEAEDSEARELLKVHVNRIRRKMKAVAPESQPHIHAVRGFGYMLSGPRSRAR
jgi:DNA-binding response OmpR family regulator